MATSQNCTSPGIPGVGRQLTDACCALLLQLLWSFYFFLCEKLLVCILLPPCAASLQGSVAKAGLAVVQRPQEMPIWADLFSLRAGEDGLDLKQTPILVQKLKMHLSNALRPVCFSRMLLTVLQRESQPNNYTFHLSQWWNVSIKSSGKTPTSATAGCSAAGLRACVALGGSVLLYHFGVVFWG